MLFIYDDELEVRYRRENAAPRSHNDPGNASSYPVPLNISLIIRKSAVEDSDTVTEPASDPVDGLWRKRDLRDHIEHASAILDRLACAVKIYFCLTAARYAIQKIDGLIAFHDLLYCILLICIKVMLFGESAVGDVFEFKLRRYFTVLCPRLIRSHKTFIDDSLELTCRSPASVKYFLTVRRPVLEKIFKDIDMRGRPERTLSEHTFGLVFICDLNESDALILMCLYA